MATRPKLITRPTRRASKAAIPAAALPFLDDLAALLLEDVLRSQQKKTGGARGE